MKRNREAGQALIFAVLALGLLLMGFVGLGIDVGYLRYEKRLQQAAADSAAIAGASDLGYGGHSAALAAAAAASATSGYSDNTGAQNTPCGTSAHIGCVKVTVNNGPASGPHSGVATSADYVEVYVAATYSTFFMRVLGIPNATVTARAVATNLSSGINNGCLFTLGNPSSKIQGININGKATLNATTCGIVDNGDYDPVGGALTVNAGTFGVAGTCSGSGCGKGSVTCANQSSANCPAYGEPAAGNPMASETPPCNPCTGGTAASSNGNYTFNPGTYTSISLSGNGTDTFNPGIYIINGSGGVSCSGTPAIIGTGVMFYFTNGATFNCQGNDNINLTAPSSSNCASCAAQYDGILMYQDPADTNGPSLGGNTGSSYGGVLYFPTSQVTFFGNANSIDVGIVIADSFALSGHPTVNLQGLSGITPPVNFVKNAILVE
jgi:hypothetical protein